MLQNYFLDFAVEHWFGCRTIEPGYAGDIGAIEVWLIDWLNEVILHYSDQGNGEYATDPGYGQDMSCRPQIYESKSDFFVKYYCKIPSRCCWLSLDTKQLNSKHREIFASLLFDKEEINFVWIQIQFIYQYSRLNIGQARL